MAEKKTKTTLDRIEELIVDGQREVLEKITKLEDGQMALEDGQRALEDGQRALEDGQRKILGVISEVHSSLKNEIVVTALAVKETVKEEIKRVEDKLDEHMRMPAHAGV